MFSRFSGAPPGASTLSYTLYPKPDALDLKLRYVNEDLQGLDGPQAILDVSVVRRNCKVMLDTIDALGTKFRAHVKTHKVGP